MRYFVFSDIHANLEAFETIIEEIKSLNPNIVVSLGDVVGYGASPAECIELVEEYSHIKICGNHDLAATGVMSSRSFNHTAQEAISWTGQSLQPFHLEIMENYDPVRRYSDCIFAHSSPISPLDWDYILTKNQAREIFEKTMGKYIFIGHTHIPGIIVYDSGNCRVERTFKLGIQPGLRYLINVGSVGQPRDGLAAASYALLDEKRRILSIRRIPYDVKSAQDKIRTAGLPESLATRLVTAK